MSDVQITEKQLKKRLTNHFIDEEAFDYLYNEQFNDFLSNRAEAFKKMFMDAGVIFKEVKQDELDIDNEDDYEVEGE